MTKKLIIFDLDGTLLDTVVDLANAVNHALNVFHLPVHPVEAYPFFVGNGINNLILRALPEERRNQDHLSMLRPEFLNYYYEHGEECTRPYPGIIELLTELQNKGYKLGVASNKIHAATLQLVKRFFQDIHFNCVYGQRDGFPIKPEPDILYQIMDEAGCTKEETLYIGDSGVDAKTSVNAGLDFIGVLWGFRPEEELRSFGATHFASTAEEILKQL